MSLSDDISIVCLCGEHTKTSEGVMSKLLDRKEVQTGIEIPQEIKPSSLKGDFVALFFAQLRG